MIKYYRDEAEAEEINQILEDLKIPTIIACVCVKDHGQEECVDFMSSCRAGVYLTVPIGYSKVLETITKQVQRKEVKCMTEKNMLEEITENLAERFKGQPNSLAASPDEVRIAWLLLEVDRLKKVISIAENCETLAILNKS